VPFSKTFTPGEILTAANVNDFLLNGGYQFRETVYFTSSGSFVKADYPWLRAIRVRMVGGGGGGGGVPTTGASQAAVASSGAGAGYAEKFVLESALAASETVTVGSGGAGGAAGANDGSAGGTSSFGSLLTCGGGGNGRAVSAGAVPRTGPRGALGGQVFSGEDFRIIGDSSPNGMMIATNTVFPYNPGGSHFGPSRNQDGGSGSDGAAGLLYGSGGVGGFNAASQGTARSGGAGADGIVIVELYG
jgi:hypothetical protein